MTEPATNIIEHQPQRVTRLPAAPGPLDIVQAAMKSGNVEMYREAVTLMKELDAFAARKAFNNALADAKGELPILKKNRTVDFVNNTGKRTTYQHEDLAEVVGTVAPILSKFGLSHRWRLRNKPNEPITVTCIISHRDGHCEENELGSAADSSGGKNPIQAVKSTVTYLERITLIASLGLAAGEDDDGRASDARTDPDNFPGDRQQAQAAAPYTPPAGSITQEQADELRDALDAKGAPRGTFLHWAGQKRIEDIPADQFESCKFAISNFKKAARS